MRSAGTLTNGVGTLAHRDHVACAGRGSSDLARVATQAFATAPDSDALLLCLDAELDWDPDVVFAAELADGRLQLADNRTAYGPLLTGGEIGDQLRVFDEAVDARLAGGFTGLRVVADNTAFLTGSAAEADRWLAWEQHTDGWQARREVTGVCWFDSDQVDPHRLAAAAHRHPLCAGDLDPQWRLVHDGEGDDGTRLLLIGEVDAFEADDLTRAIGVERSTTPADRWLDLDLSRRRVPASPRAGRAHPARVGRAPAPPAAHRRASRRRAVRALSERRASTSQSVPPGSPQGWHPAAEARRIGPRTTHLGHFRAGSARSARAGARGPHRCAPTGNGPPSSLPGGPDLRPGGRPTRGAWSPARPSRPPGHCGTPESLPVATRGRASYHAADTCGHI